MRGTRLYQRVEFWRRTAVAASLLSLAACDRPDAGAPVAPGGFNFPRAVIDFEDMPEGVTSIETVLVAQQETCIEARRAENKPVNPQVKREQLLLMPRRTVRAYYDGARMAWYETENLLVVDERTCEIELERSRYVTVIDGAQGRQLKLQHEAPAETVEITITAADWQRAPPVGANASVLRSVAGQPCVFDPSSPRGASTWTTESCFWQTHPQIREPTLDFALLYARKPDPVMPDGASTVWRATRIAVGESAPAGALDWPSADKALPPTLFNPGT
jgi:hypothetical protein